MKNFVFSNVLHGILCKILFASLLFSFIACSSDGDVIIEDPGKLIISQTKLLFLSGATTQEITIDSNFKPEDLTFEIAANAKEWCTVVMENNILKVSVSNAGFISKRSTVLSLLSNRGIRQDAIVEQLGLANELDLNPDTQIFASKVTATTEMLDTSEPTNPTKSRLAMNTIDGDYVTFHNSQAGAITEWPFIYEVTFDTPVAKIDYIDYYSRTDSGTKWGMIGEFDIYVSTQETPAYTKVNTIRYNAGRKGNVIYRATFEKATINVKSIKIEVHDGFNDRISCAELEFYKKAENLFDPSDIFVDASCSKIKDGVTQETINNISVPFYKVLADAIFNNIYDETGFRIQTYRPYQNPQIKADENWVENYGERDNPTGIYVTKAGEEVTIFVSKIPQGKGINAIVQELRTEKNGFGGYGGTKYVLNEGPNIIKASQQGLIYIDYLVTENVKLHPKTAAEKKTVEDLSININIIGGRVNGYFRVEKHTDADWKKILAYESGAKHIDVIGSETISTWLKEDYRANDSETREVSKLLDEVVYHQQEFAGTFKHNREFSNRMYLYYEPNQGAAAAGGGKAEFNPSYRLVFTTVDGLKNRVWVIAHELGHINQIRPGLNWGGVIEVTNNLYCLYTQEKWNQPSIITSGDNFYTLVNDMYYGKNIALSTFGENPKTSYSQHFLRMVPFWQLYLYTKVNGKPDFYGDLSERYRKAGLSIPGADPDGKNAKNKKQHGVLQAEFARQACHTAKMNLLDEFKKWGFLVESDIEIDDYGIRRILVTKANIDEIIADVESKGYPKPTTGTDITKITDANQNDYKGTINTSRKK